MSEFTIPEFRFPTEEELRTGAKAKFALSGAFNIERWPAEVRALSMPTKLVAVDAAEFQGIFEYQAAGWCELMQRYADQLDAEMGWDRYMIRLNSRSPKDASYPISPVTCSGKTAMEWLSTSVRVADDTSLHLYAGEPLFIALREWRPIRIDQEVRCFAKAGEVIGASRYDYGTPAPAEWANASASAYERIKAFYRDHLAEHYETVVFDLAFGVPDYDGPLLVELNPYGLSDPCCFGSYEAVENIGGFVSSLVP